MRRDSFSASGLVAAQLLQEVELHHIKRRGGASYSSMNICHLHCTPNKKSGCGKNLAGRIYVP